MEIVSDEVQLNFYMTNAIEASGTGRNRHRLAILIDKFSTTHRGGRRCIADYHRKVPWGRA